MAKTGDRPSVAVVRRLLEHPGSLPARLVAMAVEQQAPGVQRRVHEQAGRFRDAEEMADAIVKAHVRTAATEGAAAGAALTWAEATSVIGSAGTLTLPAAVVGLTVDLVALAWVQAKMVLELAAAYGADMLDHAALRRDLLALQDHDAAAAQSAGKGAGQAVRALARMVGVRTGRRLAGRLVPLANVVISARSNARATRALGEKAREHYRRRALPAVASTP